MYINIYIYMYVHIYIFVYPEAVCICRALLREYSDVLRECRNLLAFERM